MHPTPPSDGRFRALVISDDPDAPHHLLATLARAGLDCRYAPDAATGLQFEENVAPHLVLIDLASAAQTHEVIQRLRALPTVPVLLATGDAFGADALLPRPFDAATVMASVLAELKRVYHHTELLEIEEEAAEEEDRHATQEASAAPGSVVCEVCDYSGPLSQFESFSATGQSLLVCPRCRETDRLTVKLG